MHVGQQRRGKKIITGQLGTLRMANISFIMNHVFCNMVDSSDSLKELRNA